MPKGERFVTRWSIVRAMEPARRNTGCHFVAMTTSPGRFPAAVRCVSEGTLGAASAVRFRRVEPVDAPRRQRRRSRRSRAESIRDQMRPWIERPSENCHVPSPMGVISISVRPAALHLVGVSRAHGGSSGRLGAALRAGAARPERCPRGKAIVRPSLGGVRSRPSTFTAFPASETSGSIAAGSVKRRNVTGLASTLSASD